MNSLFLGASQALTARNTVVKNSQICSPRVDHACHFQTHHALCDEADHLAQRSLIRCLLQKLTWYHSVQDLRLGEIPTEADLNRGDKSLHLFSSIAHEGCRFFLVSCGAHHYVAVQQRRR